MNAERASEVKREGVWTGLRLGLEASPACLLAIDAAGTIQIANAAARELLGYSAEDLVGRPIEALVPPDVQDRHVALRDAYFAAPDVRSLGEARSISAMRRDGTPVPVEIRISSVEVGSGTLAIASLFEISKRMHLQLERDRIFELSRDLLVVNGPHRVIQRANPAVVKTLGYSEEELRSGSFLDLVHPEDREASLSRYESLLRGETLPPGETRCRCKDGTYRVILWNSAYDPDRGVIYTVGHDITERKSQEEALRQAKISTEAMNKELEAFSYSISHDLRAPLRAIDGFSLALLEDYGDALDLQAKHHLERVRRAAQRMSDLIDDLLKLARVSRRAPKWELVNLSQLVEEAVRDLREHEPGRRVEAHIAPDVVARGDRGLLDVALRNLVENAWKYSSKREDAEIEFDRAFVDGEPAYFVRDNGVGFDLAYADRLFGAFQRLHDSEEFQGTGIGLATVQRVVNLHGGRLWADAAVDEGARFTFTLGQGAGT